MHNSQTLHRNRIVFRADGSSKMGLGHIVRSMALAEMLEEAFECNFWVRDPGQKVYEMIAARYSLNVVPDSASVEEEVDLMRAALSRSDILVLDGYHFDTEYQRQLKPAVCSLVSIDDLAEVHFYADLIINHGNESIALQYKTEPYSRILTGARFALLRKPFLESAREVRNKIKKVDTLFVCMGGADPFNATNKVLRAALQTGFIHRIYVVIGSAYVFREELDEICRCAGGNQEIIVEANISASQIVERIKASQLAVCPASTIVLEVASVKCGLLTGMVADNQRAIHDMILQNGCGETIGDFHQIPVEDLCKQLKHMNDAGLLEAMMYRQSQFIDGRSDDRFLNEFKLLSRC